MREVKAATGSVKKRFRRGRGIASGAGKTSGRGHRGQKCRSGYSRRPFSEGGQTPLYRRLPKRQVNTRVNRKIYNVINLDVLQALADENVKLVDMDVLIETGVIKSVEDWGLKVLGDGELNKAITVKAQAFSETAKEAIEKAGGKVELI
ncbi:MAG: 50S ribosomal protein L15 [Candidatus Caenarcaniphilales bacterium]|jgi:large subunit ribosomal protein L15|nr:50S ribosomal protein L15 [Candidatus Caenarcaniphilales bacterium]